MAFTNPVMDILRYDTSARSFNVASNMGANANRSFQRGASMALKMDQLLQQESDRLHNNVMQSQKVLQDAVTQQISMQMKQQQMQFQKDQSAIQQDQFNKNYDLKVEQQNMAKDNMSFNAKNVVNTNNNNVVKQISDAYRATSSMLSRSTNNFTGGNTDIKRVFDAYQKLYSAYKKIDMFGKSQNTPESRAIRGNMAQLAAQMASYSGSNNPAIQQAIKFSNLLMNGIKSKDISIPGSDETVKQLYLDPNLFNDVAGKIPTAPSTLGVPGVSKQANRGTNVAPDTTNNVNDANSAPVTLKGAESDYVSRQLQAPKTDMRMNNEAIIRNGDIGYTNANKILERVQSAMPDKKAIENFNLNTIKDKNAFYSNSYLLKPSVLAEGLSSSTMYGSEYRNFVKNYYGPDFNAHRDDIKKAISNDPKVLYKVLGLNPATGKIENDERDLYNIASLLYKPGSSIKSNEAYLNKLYQSTRDFGMMPIPKVAIDTIKNKMMNIQGKSSIIKDKDISNFTGMIAKVASGNTGIGNVTRGSFEGIFGTSIKNFSEKVFGTGILAKDVVNTPEYTRKLKAYVADQEANGNYGWSVAIRDIASHGGGLQSGQILSGDMLKNRLVEATGPIAKQLYGSEKFKAEYPKEANAGRTAKRHNNHMPIGITTLTDNLPPNRFELLLKNPKLRGDVSNGIKRVIDEYVYDAVNKKEVGKSYEFKVGSTSITLSADQVAALNVVEKQEIQLGMTQTQSARSLKK